MSTHKPETYGEPRQKHICGLCGGVKLFVHTDSEHNLYRPDFSRYTFCTCGEKKHDGKLDPEGQIRVYFNLKDAVIIYQIIAEDKGVLSESEVVIINAKQALSLRDWLIQETPTLLKLAKEQEA